MSMGSKLGVLTWGLTATHESFIQLLEYTIYAEFEFKVDLIAFNPWACNAKPFRRPAA